MNVLCCFSWDSIWDCLFFHFEPLKPSIMPLVWLLRQWNPSQMLQFVHNFHSIYLMLPSSVSFECWQTNCLHKSHSVSQCIMDFHDGFSILSRFFLPLSIKCYFWWLMIQLKLAQFDTILFQKNGRETFYMNLNLRSRFDIEMRWCYWRIFQAQELALFTSCVILHRSIYRW